MSKPRKYRRPGRPGIWTALALLFLCLLYVHMKSRPFPEQTPVVPFLDSKRPLIFAHRGASAYGAENMLPAFERAVEQAADVLELDVRLTSDGVVVVIHDETLLRTAGLDRSVASLSLAELNSIDNGANFIQEDDGDIRAPRERAADARFPLRGKGLRVPTLESVFVAFPNRRINIELKADDEDLARAVYELVERNDRQSTVLVGSLHGGPVQKFRELSAGRVATGATGLEVFAFWVCFRLDVPCQPEYVALQIPVASGASSWWPNPLGDFRRPEFMAFAHRHGVKVHFWTVNDSDEMRVLLEAGADGIMSDYPDLAVGVLRSLYPGPEPERKQKPPRKRI